MKPHIFVLFLILLTLTLGLAGTVSAQAPEPRSLVGPSYQPPASETLPEWDEARPYVNRQAITADLASPAAPDIALGQPGLSYRYVRTFGETETPYFDDTSHLNTPFGLGIDGANVWIVESKGKRALKYSSSGGFLMQIGRAGLSYAVNNTSLSDLADVAVSNDGNIWVVDRSASHVVRFDAAGQRASEWGSAWDRSCGGDARWDRFCDPMSIAFDSMGRVYISERGNHRIKIAEQDGRFVASIGVTGVAGNDNAHFDSPEHIGIYGNRLYIADSANHRVQIYDIGNPAIPIYVATIGVSGLAGSDNAHLDWPTGVAADANYIYVTEGNNNRVQVFSRSSLAYVATLNAGYGQGNDQLWNPTDVGVDSGGNIYVVDRLNHRVQQFSSNRAYLRTYGTTSEPYATDGRHYNGPHGITVDPSGELIFGEYAGHRLIKLNAAGLPEAIVGQPGIPGGDNAHLDSPIGTAVDTQGNIYVVEQGNHRVQIYSGTGAYLATLGSGVGFGNYQFNSPGGIAVDHNGRIYVGDTGNHRVQVYDKYRVYQTTLGETGVCASDAVHLCGPFGVAVDAAGNIYVADAWNSRVQKFNSSRVLQMTLGTAREQGSSFDHFTEPRDVAIDTSGRIYVADIYNNRVQVFDKEGAYLTTIAGGWGSASSQLREATTVDVDAEGNVYVTDGENHRVQKYAPGVPGWRQVNINGFGERRAQWISSLLPFQGSLYAAGYPARVWRMTAAGAWSQANTDGFGDTTNNEIDALADFNNQLYAATYTWVCDDSNCSSGHTNGPQIWRSPEGSTWQNVTPAGGLGSGDRYVASLAVFDGQLYAGLGYGNTGHGAEIWRTADGLNWTRVAENGFANNIYNTDVLSFAVYNGSLYAGTRHGDWHTDDHANGPLGGEVWRSSDGTTWTRVNAPGFGALEAHRVESLQVFQNGLYAYVSHVGGTAAGADVWRCTKTLCAEQSDWAQVASNGFGVPQNQYLYAGAVSGGYLYAAVDNSVTGVQLWRTGNGTDWEKATPYDGLGNSNNRYVSDGAMSVFNGRLTLGITNWASGVGVWQKALTADFTATPTRGAPPLTVQFTNTSAGDFTSSQWDFGDGSWSEAQNPSHLYAAAGTYTVTLRVSAGAEGSTLTKPGYIVAMRSVYLPLTMRNWDPLRYDDFNDPAWDGAWNPAKWRFEGNSNLFRAIQQNGSLTFTSGGNVPAGQGATLKMISPDKRSLGQLRVFEARVKLSSDHRGGWLSVHPFIDANPINGHGWWAQCILGSGADRSPFTSCDVHTYVGSTYTSEYDTPSFAAQYDTWYTLRIEVDPTTAHLKFYLDGVLIGEHTPNDAVALVVATNFRPDVSVWNGEANASATRYVDDVRITPAR